MNHGSALEVETGNDDTAAGRDTLFYGWRIVGLTTLSQLIAIGCTSYIFGIYVEPIALEFDASRLVVSSGMAIILLTMTLVAPLLGHWLDKHSIRNTMTAGAVLMAMGLACLSQATAIWQMAVALSLLVGLGAAMLGHLPSSKLVTNWFSEHRGKAMGISTLGTSLGGFLLPPVAAWLILSVGWRASLLSLSLVILIVVAPLVYLIVRNRPQDIGLLMDGRVGVESEQEQIQSQEIAVSTILSNSSFWGIGLSVGFMASAGTILLTHFAAYSREFDVSLTGAALVISCYSATAIAGKLGFGYLADRYDKRRLLRLAIILKSLPWFIFLSPQSMPLLVVGGAAVGFGAGATMPLWNALVGSCFGRLVFARVMGYMGLVLLPLVMIPVLMGGFIFDHTGSYLLIFQLALMLFPLAFLATFLIRIPEKEPGS